MSSKKKRVAAKKTPAISARARYSDLSRGLMKSFGKKSITAETAEAAIKAAVAKARELGLNMCIAITDEAGDLKAFHRMDLAPRLSIGISKDKANTSVSFGIPTHQWWEFIKNDAPLLHGITHTPGLIVFGGGYPIKDGDSVIGGIGLSGGHYTQDMEVAKAALAAIGAVVE